MDLNECYRKGFIRKTRINEELIKSLIEMSEIKEKTVDTAKLNDMNISAYVSLAYDSVREMLEAVCVSKGYRILNHVCMGEFLKDNIKEFDYNEFDRFRYIRNGINYYGTKVQLSQGKQIIEKMFKLKKTITRDCLADFQ